MIGKNRLGSSPNSGLDERRRVKKKEGLRKKGRRRVVCDEEGRKEFIESWGKGKGEGEK